MKKSKTYENTCFSADVLKEALHVFYSYQEPKVRNNVKKYLSVKTEDSNWSFDTEEEYFAEYRRFSHSSVYEVRSVKYTFRLQTFTDFVSISVGAPERRMIESVFEVFEKHFESSRLEIPSTSVDCKPRVFIGHGRNALWRDLKDHLQDKHGYPVEAYEMGARAGHAIRDILEDMLANSSFALLVMTGEDETTDGDLQARQNIVHESGLFQGKLGFNRAIILLEEGTTEFSNIHGIEQIRFSQGNIKETFGDVLATLKREFNIDVDMNLR